MCLRRAAEKYITGAALDRAALEQRLFLYVTHVKYGRARKFRRTFRDKYRNE
jgi:hypothetical protein